MVYFHELESNESRFEDDKVIVKTIPLETPYLYWFIRGKKWIKEN
jgi:hypothetical protein